MALKFCDFKSTKDSYYESLELLHYKYVYTFTNVYTNDAYYVYTNNAYYAPKHWTSFCYKDEQARIPDLTSN